MLPKELRLKSSDDFQEVFAKGTVHSLRGIFVKILSTKNQKTKIGFVVSKSCAKTAVERNRFKKMMGAAIKPSLKTLRPGFNIIVGYNAKEKYSNSRDLEPIIAQLLAKSKVLS